MISFPKTTQPFLSIIKEMRLCWAWSLVPETEPPNLGLRGLVLIKVIYNIQFGGKRK